MNIRIGHSSRHPSRIVTTEFAQHQGGFVMLKFALLLIPLLLMVGLSVDVGYWYNRTAAIQKAADAASLAGVVWLPNESLARQYAQEAAKRNGFEHGVDGITVSVTPLTGDANRLRVTIQDPSVGSFFYESLSDRRINIQRRSTAEYVLPVPMGSPENSFGNDPTASGYPTGAPNLWASISGPNTAKADGDPYSTRAGGNTEYRDWGYLYVIDIPAGAVGRTLDLAIYDAGHYARDNYPNVETADSGTVNTQFELYRPDSTPLDSLDGLVPAYSMAGNCTGGTPGRFRLASGTSSSTYRNRWVTLCRMVVSTPGKYVMQVKSSNIPTITDGGSGWNQFSIRAVMSAAPQPTLYAVGDLSMFNNLPGRTGNINANFFLARIDPQHAGKTLEISLFDPGDGRSGTYYANIRGPANSVQTCRYRERGTGSWVTSANCRIATRTGGTNQYNGKWLDIQVTVPTLYSCTDCWWKVLYEFQGVTSGNSPNDRTVWSARVVGDPVHLLEEDT